MEAYATLGQPTTGVMTRGPGRASPSCALLAYRCLTTDILLGKKAAIVCIDNASRLSMILRGRSSVTPSVAG